MKTSSSTPTMTTKRVAFSFLGGMAVLVFGGFALVSDFTNNGDASLRVDGGEIITIEVADSDAERLQGLSGRQSLDQRSGMLFVYDSPGNYAFVMRGMRFPLDFVWIDANKTIIEITPDVSPDTYPSQAFNPSALVQYILEVNAGTADRENWQVGDKVEFNVD